MYTQEDYLENRKQLKKRLMLLAIPSALLIIGIVFSLIYRIQWLTMVLTIVLGGMAIFCYSMLLSPVMAYGRHIDNMLNGRKREATGYLLYFEADTVWREGVEYHAMMINIGETKDEEDDRLFYFDAHREFPNIEPGTKINIVAHDKAVAFLSVVS